jgi:uncharacterized Fe-S cluster protein YjdI
MDKNIKKKYANNDITIVWKPALCIHSAKCFNGLPAVFDPRERPWVTISGAGTDTIINQINHCPSGALSYYRNNEEEESPLQVSEETKIEAIPNGPLLVYGNVLITDAKGREIKKNKVTAFCRCGQSGNKPFCDGSHSSAGFQD